MNPLELNNVHCVHRPRGHPEERRAAPAAGEAGDLYVRTGEPDRAAELSARAGDTLSREGFHARASALSKKVLKLKPDDERGMLRAAELAAEQGLLADARRGFEEVARLRGARADSRGAAEMMIRIAALDPNDVEARKTGARARLVFEDAAGAVDDLKSLAGELAEDGRETDAIAVLREAIALAPGDTELVERIVALHVARGEADLAASYLPPDAAFRIAESQATAATAAKDWKGAVGVWRGFLGRHPAHVAALRRLVDVCVEGGLKAELNEAQLELVDAHVLNGEVADARFVAEDLVAREPGVEAHLEALHRALVMAGESDPDAIVAERRPKASVTDIESRAFELGPNAVNIERILDADEGSPAETETIEVPAALDMAESPRDLDEVFAEMRHDAAGRLEQDDEERYREGLALFESGLAEEAIPALTDAARAPKLRFVAADLLGRIYRDRNMPADAVDWFERAAEAPPPTRAEGHRLLYDLANLLESSGEIARALAIYMELRAEAGDFRDVAARVARLDEQARG